MEKLKMHSPDLTQSNLQRIQEAFPNCITESEDANGKLKLSVDFDLLKQELSDSIVEGPQERYQLNWPGKREALLTANAPITKTLRPCREESVNFDETENLFIEGDNLDALKLLQETYLGKVKMIYIDPPYNRGDDLLYQDDFAEGIDDFLFRTSQVDETGGRLLANTETNGRFHSDWLSNMYMRLKLSRNLLTDNGVIFISIGDDEFHNLKNTCNEVFGEKNCLGTILWKKKTNGNNVGQIPPVHDFILCYAKNASDDCLLGFPASQEFIQANYSNPDGDPNGPWTTSDLSANHEGPLFEIENPNTGKKYLPSRGRYWVFNEREVAKRIEQGLIIFGKTGQAGPVQKKYLKDRGEFRMKPESWWDSHGLNADGTAELGELFSPKIFDHPKPVKLLSKIVEISSKDNDLILDYFAGSGSTAHAVMHQNQVDGFRRRFISIQYPEEPNKKESQFSEFNLFTIADLCKERIRRAGARIKEEHATSAPDLDIGFRVLKVDSSNLNDIHYAPDEQKAEDLLQSVENIKPDRSGEDLLFQVLLDWGVDLTLPIRSETVQGKTVYFVAENALIACFDRGVSEELVKELATHEPLRMVFLDTSFESDQVKINVTQILKQLSPETDVRSI